MLLYMFFLTSYSISSGKLSYSSRYSLYWMTATSLPSFENTSSLSISLFNKLKSFSVLLRVFSKSSTNFKLITFTFKIFLLFMFYLFLCFYTSLSALVFMYFYLFTPKLYIINDFYFTDKKRLRN